MKIRIDEITADIEAADFSTDAAALTFKAKMCSDYCARELFTYEGFLPRWSFKTQSEEQRFVLTWKQITLEARSLISQARTLGVGAIKNRLVRGANGTLLPHPLMNDDLDDGLFDMSVVTLRQTVARALENNATVQDLAHKVDAARGDIAAVGADAHAGRVAAETLADERTRTDKGKKHHKRKKISGAWRSARDVAEDFDKVAFMPKGGNRKLGTCSEEKINRWDAECPDYDHRNKWGYYAELRINGDLKSQYYEVLKVWGDHWKAYKAWDKQHPGTKFRPMRRTDIDPDRMGTFEGKTYVRPKTDNEMSARARAMKKRGLRTHYSA